MPSLSVPSLTIKADTFAEDQLQGEPKHGSAPGLSGGNQLRPPPEKAPTSPFTKETSSLILPLDPGALVLSFVSRLPVLFLQCTSLCPGHG
jgi:hypothetical protein